MPCFFDVPPQNKVAVVSGAAATAATAAAAAAAALGLLVLKYNDRVMFYKPKNGVVFIKGHPLIGMLYTLMMNRHRYHDHICNIFETHDIMTFEDSVLGRPPSITTIDPANIEYVLKTNFPNYIKGKQLRDVMGGLFGHGIFVANGERWKYQRKAASLIFNISQIRDRFTEVFVKHLHVAAEHIFDKKAEDGTAVNFQDVMVKFTFDSFVLIGFGKEMNFLTSKENIPFMESFDISQTNMMHQFINPYYNVFEFLQPIFSPGTLTSSDHHKIIDEFAYEVIRERRESGDTTKDLLSHFMSTRNEKGEILTDIDLRDSIVNFILAGRDTTALSLSWTFYNLMLHPRVEAKLLEEIKNTIRDEHESDPAALYEAIRSMTYAHAVFYEVLRLYPVVPFNIKNALEDDVLPDGTPIQKGDSFNWASYTMGRSTKLWGPDAKDFRPERWIEESGELHRESSAKWPAFHAGPRSCLGQSLATVQSLVVIALLLRRYKFVLAHDQDITYCLSLTMPMANGMKVYVERRC